jgi:hypothetical protein
MSDNPADHAPDDGATQVHPTAQGVAVTAPVSAPEPAPVELAHQPVAGTNTDPACDPALARDPFRWDPAELQPETHDTSFTTSSTRGRTVVVVLAAVVAVLSAAGVFVWHEKSSVSLSAPASLGGMSPTTDPGLEALQSGIRDQASALANGANYLVAIYGTIRSGRYAELIELGVRGSNDNLVTVLSGITTELPPGTQASEPTQVGDSLCTEITAAASTHPVASACARSSGDTDRTVVVVLVGATAQDTSALVDEAWAH